MQDSANWDSMSDDKKEALEAVAIGDAAVLDYDFTELRNGLVVGLGLDDRGQLF